jgi:putative ABC transport system permease protein
MLKYALNLVLRHKLRTVLTGLGITIAIVLLTFIIFGMNGLQKVLLDSFENQFKPNQIYISNSSFVNMGGGLGGSEEKDNKEPEELTLLTDETVSKIRDYEYVDSVDPMTVVTGFQIQVESEKTFLSPSFITGWDVSTEDGYFMEYWGEDKKLEQGEAFLSKLFADNYKKDPEDLIGETVVIKTSSGTEFGALAQKNSINKEYKFEVKGVFDPGQDRNDLIISLADSTDILADLGGFADGQAFAKETGYDAVRVEVQKDKYEESKKWLEDEFNFAGIIGGEDTLKLFDQIFDAFKVGLSVFAIIAATVASIGIVNTMVMNIFEQKKEIGLIKALGASNLQVMGIYLLQSMFIGLLGGVLGVILVVVVLKAADPLIVNELVKAGFRNTTTFFVVDVIAVAEIVGASLVLGLLAGLYPSFRASRIDPAQTLRDE